MQQSFLSDFHDTVLVAEQKLLALSETQSETPRAPGKWTPKQIIGHLIDSASNNHQRFVRGQLFDNVELNTYEQEKWVNIQHHESQDWATLVSFWQLYNFHLIHIIKYVSDDALKSSHSMKGEPVTLEYLITDYLTHLKHHLNQIITL